jgi:hypothetical protein
MITVLRRHHRWLMIVIAILAIPFCLYFTKTDFSARRNDDLGKIYGRTVTRIEFQRNARLFNLARDLGMMTLLQDLTTGATSEVSAYSEFTWNRLILQHEEERLGIRPTNAEIVNLVRTFQPFAGQSGFDMNKYNEFVSSELPALGFTEAQIEELAADQLALTRLKEIVGSGVQVAESESKDNYERSYGKMDVGVVRLSSADFKKEVKLSDEDIAKYFESHKTQLNTEEKRKVEFVALALSDEQKKLTGKERVEVLQKLADRANDFAQALLDKSANFAAVAGKFQVPVQATGEFTTSAPDPQLKADPQLAQYAFRLTPQEPFSDPIQSADGFYIMHLIGKTDARPLTLEEAKPKIVEDLTNDRVRELAQTKGTQIVTQLREKLKFGAPLDAAAQQAGVKIDRLPAFSVLEPPGAKPEPPKEPKAEPPDVAMIKNTVSELSPGETTDFVPTESGGVVAVLEKREPIDPAAFQQTKAVFDSRYLRGKRNIAFYEWLRDRRSAAGIQAEQPQQAQQAGAS